MSIPHFHVRTLMIAVAVVALGLGTLPAIVNASPFNWLFLYVCAATLVLCVTAAATLSWVFDALLKPPSPPRK